MTKTEQTITVACSVILGASEYGLLCYRLAPVFILKPLQALVMPS